MPHKHFFHWVDMRESDQLTIYKIYIILVLLNDLPVYLNEILCINLLFLVFNQI
jgi:hypothetical protein